MAKRVTVKELNSYVYEQKRRYKIMKIVVLAGGTSTEREISIVSGTGICGALRQKGHEAILVDIFCGVENVDWENPLLRLRIRTREKILSACSARLDMNGAMTPITMANERRRSC